MFHVLPRVWYSSAQDSNNTNGHCFCQPSLESQCIVVSNLLMFKLMGREIYQNRNLLSRNMCTEFSVGKKCLSQKNMVCFFPIMKGHYKLLGFIQVQFVFILVCPVSILYCSALAVLICLTSQLQSGSLRAVVNEPKKLIKTISFPKVTKTLYTFHWLNIIHSMLKLKALFGAEILCYIEHTYSAITDSNSFSV